MRKGEDVVRRFIEAINEHDLHALSALMSDDHTFIDSLGRVLNGRQAVLDAWPQYFSWFPDYSIIVSQVLSSGSTVAVFGSASGTLASSHAARNGSWRIPAAWRATVRGQRIAEWQVYADNKPVYELLSRSSATT